MGPEVVNKNKNCVFNGSYAGRDLYITMYQDSEREFVVTHNANIKPVAYFTGRETELRELRQRIEEGRKSVLVSGMGGIGKTHICRKLFEEYSGNGNGLFSHIGYIEYNGDMDSSLQKCLRYKEQENPELNKIAAWKELGCLASEGKLLLFVDNVNVTVKDDPSLERLKQLPGAIVLTSRRTSFSTEFERFRIGFLDKEQCREIYEKIRFEDRGIGVKEEEVPDLEFIIEGLAAKHTITVEHLAHLARVNDWTVKTLREQLESKRFQLEYVDDEEKLINIQESYEALYDLSQLTTAEQNILEAFSVFPYIPLEKEICNQWLLADAGVSKEENVLFKLYRKGWLQFDMEQESYALHPVFAQFIYEKCKPKIDNHSGMIEQCQKYMKIPQNGFTLRCQRYLPFAEKIIDKVNMGKSSKQFTFLHSIANLLHKTAEYKKAEELFWKLLISSRLELGENNSITAVISNNLACLYESQGKYKKAEELCKEALRIEKKIGGKESLDIIRIRNNLAYLYDVQGKHEKAENLFKKNIGMCEKVLGEESVDTAVNYNNLAIIYRRQGKYKKAEEFNKKCLRIREWMLGEEHPDTAVSYCNLAMVHECQGEYGKAKKLYEKSVCVFERVLGKEHPYTAISYNNLASLYASQKKHKIALIYYPKAYKILLFRLGLNHPNTQTVHENMKLTYEEWNPEGDFGQWLEEQMKAVEM